ncbi:MAG TPA: cyclic nucleotide-gated ion channel [Verrucomicrobiae bacterium]|nr:cyclic nucleotide-gated ion channel [Verrucomicrobiae bacterium]
MAGGVRDRITELLDARGDATGRKAVTALLLTAIAAATIFGLFATLPDLDAGARVRLRLLGGAAVIVFTLEYLLRLWIAPSRRRYALSFPGVIDLLTALPFWLHLTGIAPPMAVIMGMLLASVKLSRYVPGFGLVGAVFHAERRALFAALIVLAVLLLLSSGIMYLLERDAQPDVFTSIPKTLWWAIVTIASVGYGDMTPVTALGRIFGGVVILIGIATFAVPAGLLATGFAAELRKRDFVVTWRAVAQVPLFANLDAVVIADIARLLRPEIVPARYAIMRRGDAADAMYFILSGEVQVELPQGAVPLRNGQFFGEIALLHDRPRSATVTAVTECHLLVLEVRDFRNLLQRYPQIDAAIRKIAEERQPSEAE